MALGWLIGAAVAAKVAESAASVIKSVKSADDVDQDGLDFGDIKNAAVNSINNFLNKVDNDSISSRANMVNAIDQNSISGKANMVGSLNKGPVTTEYEFEQAKETFCEYCDGLIPLTKGYSNCPHCGAQINRSAIRLVVKTQRSRPVYVVPP